MKKDQLCFLLIIVVFLLLPANGVLFYRFYRNTKLADSIRCEIKQNAKQKGLDEEVVNVFLAQFEQSNIKRIDDRFFIHTEKENVYNQFTIHNPKHIIYFFASDIQRSMTYIDREKKRTFSITLLNGNPFRLEADWHGSMYFDYDGDLMFDIKSDTVNGKMIFYQGRWLRTDTLDSRNKKATVQEKEFQFSDGKWMSL